MKLLIALAIALTGCGSSGAGSNGDKHSSVGMPLELEYLDMNGATKKVLASDEIFFTFSTETCSACNTEAEHYSAYLKGQKPKIKMLTILSGSSTEDAKAWAYGKGAKWDFGTNKGSAAYKKYCPANLVPCNLIAKGGKIVYGMYGEVSIQTIEAYLGKMK